MIKISQQQFARYEKTCGLMIRIRLFVICARVETEGYLSKLFLHIDRASRVISRVALHAAFIAGEIGVRIAIGLYVFLLHPVPTTTIN
jgi:hypothetical protein